jgi:putative cell wall-binding protein
MKTESKILVAAVAFFLFAPVSSQAQDTNTVVIGHTDSLGNEIADSTFTVVGNANKIFDSTLQKMAEQMIAKVNQFQTNGDAVSHSGQIHKVSMANPSNDFIDAVLKDAASRKSILVLDGVVTSEAAIRQMTAKEFTQVDVLQGAEASKHFGAKGQNGAVVFTTKPEMPGDSSAAPASY